ncbi:putative ferric reductase [Roseinatronobacter thiooxidans]|uniref:Putative ferric reductase n=1 Tax=Roseinatronobacter thiooxidans TaxID=121821 RepID=A0A2W7PTK0_9RHOB|nr:ferric reductase-like transmembrane domain-containing protein [Roseinatronobacter thiooxidans]PZX39538.1 putative ferric reductase [Roseinatronobacter thiooxidans]
MAQPDPAPIPKTRQLGGKALAAIYLAVALLPLALALGRQVVPLDPWERLGAGVGLVALTAMAVQFVTSGRFGIVSGRLGIDQIMGFHKIAAWWVLLGLLLHPLFYVLPTWADDPARGLLRLHAYVTLPHYRSGVVSLAALALLVLTSSLRERLPLTYEMWRASHVVLAITAAATGLHHAVTVGRFSALGAVHAWWWAVAGALALVMATLYGWRWLALHRYPWRLHAVEKRADRIWELDIQPAQGTPDLRFDAGQFVWMTVGAKRFPLFDHPFSIASAPAQPGLSLIIKEAGDFTGQIGTLAPGTPVGIDGPYGEFSLDNHPACAVVLVAGGAGIGPIMGLLRELVLRKDKRPIRLAYAVGQKDNFACLDEIEQAQSVLDLQIMLLCEQDDDGFDGEIGHLDHKRLAQVTEGLDKSRTVAMMCGPGPMLVAVSDMLLDIGLDMTRIVYERFDYASGATSRQDRKRMAQLLSVGAGLVAGIGVFMAVALL